MFVEISQFIKLFNPAADFSAAVNNEIMTKIAPHVLPKVKLIF